VIGRNHYAPPPNPPRDGKASNPVETIGCAVVAGLVILGVCGFGAWVLVSVLR
jgi:hypothetical protein